MHVSARIIVPWPVRPRAVPVCAWDAAYRGSGSFDMTCFPKSGKERAVARAPTLPVDGFHRNLAAYSLVVELLHLRASRAGLYS